MKFIRIGFAGIAITLAACNSNSGSSAASNNSIENKDSVSISEATSVKVDTSASAGQKNIAKSFSIKEIIAGYLQLKNALTNDNGQNAAIAGNTIIAALANTDAGTLSNSQRKEYVELQEDVKEQAEHISGNGDKIEHQREHFVMLSEDMAQLIKTFGNGGTTLYSDFCPMANENKGAIWISEMKEIKNPYFGSKMPECGTVKQIIE